MHRGYVTLLSVLVVGAVGVSIATSLILSGLATSRTSFTSQQSTEARALADACVEEGLQKIRSTTAYSGSGSLSLGHGSCTYTVTKQSGAQRTVTASGTVGTAVRKVRAVITAINPTLTVSTWQEVADL